MADHYQQLGTEALASTVLAWCARQNIRPGALAVLLAVAAGCDSVAEVVAHTGMPLTTVRTGLRRCTGKGRWHEGRKVQGTEAALLTTRPHPHAQGNGALQLLLTRTGGHLAKALLGDANASAELKGPAA